MQGETLHIRFDRKLNTTDGKEPRGFVVGAPAMGAATHLERTTLSHFEPNVGGGLAAGPVFCYNTPMLISWDIALGLMLIAFVLPFIFLHLQLEAMRRHARHDHVEKEHLRHLLRELEEHVQKDKSRFLDALGAPFLLLRPSGRLVMANREAGELLGIDETRNTNLLHILKDSPLHSLLMKAARAEKQMSTVVQVQREDGLHHYRCTATPLRNNDRHVGIVFHNITGEHRTMVIRRNFVANASHELRTPLTIIRGYVETLLEDPDTAADPALRARALTLVKKHTGRIIRLVEDMLALSRLENEETGSLKREDFDLACVAEDVRLRLEGLVQKQQAELSIGITPAPFLLHGDRAAWSQVLFNLMENALKNNPAPGLRVRVTASRTVEGGALLEVEDNGIGIAPEAIPFIFNRFFRADSTGKVKGTGLGLSIVRHAVKAHGGSICAESTPGVKTIFRITLPPQKSKKNA